MVSIFSYDPWLSLWCLEDACSLARRFGDDAFGSLDLGEDAQITVGGAGSWATVPRGPPDALKQPSKHS